MPSIRKLSNLDQYSSKYRCAMRGKKLNNTARSSLETKSSRSRSTRQQGSIIIEFRRWLAEFWKSVINRLKCVFLNSRKLQTPRSLTSKIPDMDPDYENAFWRDGGPRYIHRNHYPKIKTKISYSKTTVENRDTDSQSRSRRNPAPIYSDSYKNNQWPKSRRRSTRNIADFTATETTDDEYFALYKKTSHCKKADKLNGTSFSNSSGDCIIEPIESILSRYQRKSSKPRIEMQSESSVEDLEISDERKSLKTLEKYSHENQTLNNPLGSSEDSKWIETNCYESVWYSKSELNITPERKSAIRSRNQVSRIPRPRHMLEKRSARASRPKNYSRPSSVCQ